MSPASLPDDEPPSARSSRASGAPTCARAVALLLAFIELFAAVTPSKSAAPLRWALVIGNLHYRRDSKWHELRNTTDDADRVAETLRQLGFKIEGSQALHDLDRAALSSVVNQFARDSAGAEVSFFFYAGHGLESHDRDWIVPTDARDGSANQTYDVQNVLDGMQRAKSVVNLVVVDACRSPITMGSSNQDNPFEGLKPLEMPNFLMLFPTQRGKEAYDDTMLPTDLVKRLKQKREIQNVFNLVALDVKSATRDRIVPSITGDGIKETYLAGGGESASVTAPAGVIANRLAVVASLGNGAVAADLSRFEAQLGGSILAGGHYTLVDPSKLAALRQGQRFSHSSMADPKTAAQLGKMLGASMILIANVAIDVQIEPEALLTQIAATTSSDYQLLDVATATVVKSGSSDGSGNEKAAVGSNVTPLQKRARIEALDSCAQTLAEQLAQ